jgi:glutamine amidotransferase
MINIVDYGMGNLRSVQKAVARIGMPSRIVSSVDDVLHSEKLILPGVGHFARAVTTLKSNGLFAALNHAVQRKKIPILGICLGMQLMTEFSEEGGVEGFGWVRARTTKFSFADRTLRIPHMGWNRLSIKKVGSLFKSTEKDDFYYFVHSYFITCANQENILSETSYGNTFVSAFEHENIFGCQFHPEKSHDPGLMIIKTFAEL